MAEHQRMPGVFDAVPGLSPAEREDALALWFLESDLRAEALEGRAGVAQANLRVVRASERVFAAWMVMVDACERAHGIDEEPLTDSEVAAALRLFLAEVELRAPWDPDEAVGGE
ncbi:hypothetical protein IEE94_11450 [Yimella sp. cx-573]|nr:hypothetical protein [Yimella sp. cx-573]